ncbi:MAG: sterol desaturase family protein [Pseudomonadales bacterium]|nr:sterol desaturase family protein [Pseudomonadales bacterium]
MPLDILLRLSVFFSVLSFMLLWQNISPRRDLGKYTLQRWRHHISLTIINSLAAKLVMPIGLSGLALIVHAKQWGLMHLIQLPAWLELIIVLVLLDLLIYWQHRLFHVVPVLWRLHRVHHSDLAFDSSTALRFHPLEIVLSVFIKATAVIILGISAQAILIFEILLNALALFNHGNVYIPKKIDTFIRYFIVSPDMHRVHHSTQIKESNCNFGFNLSCWDRLFSSYLYDSQAGQLDMPFGLEGCNYEDQQRISQLLKQPLTHFSGQTHE